VVSKLYKRLLAERAHENGLGLSVMDITAGMFTIAACLPEVLPVGCLVAGACKTTGIYKCFRYKHGMPVNMHPVSGKTA